jgi:hypothetical protein
LCRITRELHRLMTPCSPIARLLPESVCFEQNITKTRLGNLFHISVDLPLEA